MKTPGIMWTVVVASIPGLAAMTHAFGSGVLWNVAILIVACIGVEAAAVAARTANRQETQSALSDGSAVLTAILIAICLPPFVDPLVLGIAAIAAIGLAKHAYGGLGQNTFNPAMVGYAVILVSYPEALAHWPQPDTDALTGATLLSQFRFRESLTAVEFATQFTVDTTNNDLIALAFLAGGLYLARQRLIAWRIPVAVLGSVAVLAFFGYDQGSSQSHGSIWFHWTTGGLVAAAFFVATDPVTHPTRHSHQLLFGVLIGAVVYWIRVGGAYPDGIAFAVLLANCVSPLLNRIHFREAAHA